MSDGVDGVISDILNAIGAGIATVARKAFNAIQSVWNVSTDFWWRLGLGHFSLLDALTKLRDMAEWFGSRVGIGIWWIIHVFVPKWVQNAVSEVMRWVVAGLTQLRNVLTALVHDVITWASRLISAIQTALNRFITWVETEIGKLWHDLTATIKIVSHFLTDPAVLVGWFWDALWAKVKDWARSNEEWLARWLLARAIRGTIGLADIIENLIIRIL